MSQQLNELRDPLSRILYQSSSAFREVRVALIEDIAGDESAEIDDGLVGAGHETGIHCPELLVGVEFFMCGALEDRVVLVLGEEGLGFVIVSTPAEAGGEEGHVDG